MRNLLDSNRVKPLLVALIFAAIVMALGGWIAQRQRDALEKMVSDVQAAGVQLEPLGELTQRGVVEATADYDQMMRLRWPWSAVRLDKYLQGSRVVNSYLASNAERAREIRRQDGESSIAEPGTGDGAREVTRVPRIPIPWYVVFFGWEQYACFFLAAFCWAELRRLRLRLRKEEWIARKTRDAARLNTPDDQAIQSGSAQAALDHFMTECAAVVYGKRRAAERDQRLLRRLLRFTWVAIVERSLTVYARTGDRIQALEAATSTRERDDVRFDGQFHIEQYLQWAIPSVGFLGTIRGISAAMDAAQSAADLPTVVSYLGVAFYSTLTALVLNLLLMGRRAMTLNYRDEVFVRLDEALRAHVLSRLAGYGMEHRPRSESAPPTAAAAP